MKTALLTSIVLLPLTFVGSACDEPTAVPDAAADEFGGFDDDDVEFRSCTPPCFNAPYHGTYEWTNLYQGGSASSVIGRLANTPDGQHRIAVLGMSNGLITATRSRVSDTGQWQLGNSNEQWFSPEGFTLTIGVYDLDNNPIDTTKYVRVADEVIQTGGLYSKYSYDLVTNWNPGTGYSSAGTGLWHVCPMNPQGDYTGNWQPNVYTQRSNAPSSQPRAGLVSFTAVTSGASYHCNESGPGKLSRQLEVFANAGTTVGRNIGIDGAEATVNAIRAVAPDADGKSLATTAYGMAYYPVHLDANPKFDTVSGINPAPGWGLVLEAIYDDSQGWNCKYPHWDYPNGVHRNDAYDAPGQTGHIFGWHDKPDCSSGAPEDFGQVAVYVFRPVSNEG